MQEPFFQVRLLGPLEVLKRTQSGEWVATPKKAWGETKHAQSVLKRLLAAPGRTLTRGAIQDALWPDADDALVDKYLNNAISLLYGIFGKENITRAGSVYRLASQSVIWADRDASEALLRQAENQGPTDEASISLLEEAASYFEQGSYLAGEDGAWCYSLRRLAEKQYKQARRWLAACYEANGKYLQAEKQYHALVYDFSDQTSATAWIALLERQGDQQEAQTRTEEIRAFFAQQGLLLTPQQQSLQVLTHHSLPAWTPTDAILSLPATSDHVSVLRQPFPLSEETLPLFAHLNDICRQFSEGNELRVAESLLWTYLPKIELIAQHSDQAASIASQGYLLAASLVGHRNDLLRRLRCAQTALTYGALAKDLNLQAVAMRQIAISFDYLDQPAKGVEVLQQVLPYLNRLEPILQACIYAELSGAYAALHQKQESLRSIALAYECFPEHYNEAPGYLRTICRPSTLPFFEALNRLAFGQPQEAEAILDRIDGLHPAIALPERVRIELLNYQVEVFLALREKDRASAYLENSAKASLTLGSERHFREAFTLYRRMQTTWTDDAQIQRLGDLFLR